MLAISLPWSHANDAFIISGRSLKNSMTASAVGLARFEGRASSPVNPLIRSTSVAAHEVPFFPMIRSPSQCPGHPTLGGVLTSLRDRDHTYDWATARPPGRTWSALGPLGLQEDALAGELTLRDCVDVLVDSLTGRRFGPAHQESSPCVQRSGLRPPDATGPLSRSASRSLRQVGVDLRPQHRHRDLPLLRASPPTLRSTSAVTAW